MKRLSTRLTHIAERGIKSWFGWAVFGIVAYIASIYLTSAIIFVVSHLDMFSNIDTTVFSLLMRIVMYAVLVAIVILVPIWLRQRLSLKDMGMDRPMLWKDIGIGIAGIVLYLLAAMAALALVRLIPGVDITQSQDLGIGQVFGTTLVIAFIVLVVIVPFAEELLFRGLLYGGLRKRRLPVWASALTVSLLFGLAHGQLNVSVDVFFLSLIACYARELTGSIWAGVVLHMIKNFIAFSIVFLVNQPWS